MDFDFSDDQEQLRDAVRKWVDKAYTFERRRSIAKDGGFSSDAWRELAELGLCGLYIPEALGGLGMGPVEGMVVMEELGRGIVLEPLTQALMAGAVLGHYVPQPLATQWAGPVASGESLVSLAYLERASRYQLDKCSTEAGGKDGAFTLRGSKSLVVAGDKADAFLVSAQLDGKLAMFLVERTAPGVTVRAYGTLDGGRAAELTLDQAAAQLVSKDGLAVLEHAVDIGIAATCAQAVGVMDKTLAITAEYLNTRKQFGVVISSFQALRHRVADMKMQLELARSMSYYASLKLNAPAPERRAAMARAKVQLGQSMRFMGQQAVQLHGGIGVTDEYIVSHYFKCLTQMEMEFGDSLFHLGEVSRRMQDSAGVFA
jgi:alkylation response protein AidB-like acyl-CoA dehydrogenase